VYINVPAFRLPARRESKNKIKSQNHDTGQERARCAEEPRPGSEEENEEKKRKKRKPNAFRSLTKRAIMSLWYRILPVLSFFILA
jgi:hypothetical protein